MQRPKRFEDFDPTGAKMARNTNDKHAPFRFGVAPGSQISGEGRQATLRVLAAIYRNSGEICSLVVRERGRCHMSLGIGRPHEDFTGRASGAAVTSSPSSDPSIT